MKVRRVLGVVAALSLLVACDDGDSGGKVAQDGTNNTVQLDSSATTATAEQDSVATTSEQDTTVAENDTSSPADTTVSEDTSTPVDTTVAEDTSTTTDVPTPECNGACLELGAGVTGIIVTNKPNTENPPDLTGPAGAPLPSGDYLLHAIDVYTKGTFNTGLVTKAEITDNGASSGTNTFASSTIWGYFLDLDIHYNLTTTIAGNFEGDSRQMIGGGGCYTIDGDTLSSETGRCDTGWPDNSEPPSEFEFGYSGTDLLVKIVLSKEFIIGLIPPDQQTLAGLAVSGPLVFVATFNAVVPD